MSISIIPPGLLSRLEPVRRELRAIIADIHRDPWNRELWREADNRNRRMLEIEREFFSERRAA